MEKALEELLGLGTTTVSDACDRLGINAQAVGIMPLDRNFRLAGRAFTVKTIPSANVNPGNVGDYIDEVKEGQVVVLDNEGKPNATVWGDILTIMSHRNKLAGTVIHGVCRDASRSLDLGYPIFSRGNTMRTGKDRVECVGINEQCSLGEVHVNPNDVLIGDADGVVVIPQERVDEVLKIGKEIEAAEDNIRAEIAKGSRLDAAREKFRYHALQTRSES